MHPRLSRLLLAARHASSDHNHRRNSSAGEGLLGQKPRPVGCRVLNPLLEAQDACVGGFAGPVAPDAPVGTYGNGKVLRRQGAGGFAGDPDHQRQGSFADTDRVVIFTYKADAERVRVTGLRGARRLLGRAALDDDTVDRAVDELHRGHAVVLVDAKEIVASEARAQLEQDARAA
jgi:hypothetical protein